MNLRPGVTLDREDQFVTVGTTDNEVSMRRRSAQSRYQQACLPYVSVPTLLIVASDFDVLDGFPGDTESSAFVKGDDETLIGELSTTECPRLQLEVPSQVVGGACPVLAVKSGGALHGSQSFQNGARRWHIRCDPPYRSSSQNPS